VIKPCTPAEVAFYEHASASHPELAYYMPRFMGILQLGNQTPATVPIPTNGAFATLDIAEAPTLDLPATHAPSNSIPPEITPDVSSIHSINLPIATHAPSSSVLGTAAELSIRDPGPLKGKKLDTDLHIVLENVSAGFKHPNILDLKLGARLWDEDAKPEKRARLDKVASETTSGSLGFRIAGMRVWQGEARSTPVEKLEDVIKEGQAGEKEHWFIDEDTNHRNYNKFYGRQFSAENILEAFKEYLLVPSAGVGDQHASIVVSGFISDLKDIQQVLESKESRMYSASLLFVYEGNPEALQQALDAITNAPEPKATVDTGDEEEDEEDQEELPRVYAVKLIDFAHAKFQKGLGPDENMLSGVRNSIRILEKLLKDISE
jgi:1D-myo-inositol-tetrakisphosphate 5-kinase/inositol-polyphosphate multikinase